MSLPTGLEAFARDVDRDFFARELSSFVPERVFDAHCHLWPDRVYGPPETPRPLEGLRIDGGLAEYRALIRALFPGRQLAALFIPFWGTTGDVATANEWAASQARQDPRCRHSFAVRPGDDPEWVRSQVRRLGARGLKCYHTFCAHQPTWEAEIPEYLPEPLVRVAHEEGLVITLHLVRRRAVADPSNRRWIREYCTRYPRMQLVLAHSARAFQPAHAFEGLPHLRGLDNLWVDCSANCEPMAHAAALRLLGPERFLYGSDFFVSHLRGRSLAAGDSFLWLYESTPVWDEKHARLEPVLVGLEQLRSLKWACWSERLSDAQVEAVFWGNAARLFYSPSSGAE
ncbi:MAG: amidohydrolase family protein [Candidatus Latescibacterota bacterium]